MRSRNNYFQQALNSDGKVIILHRDKKGWYYKIWFIKIYFDKYNRFQLNEMLKIQNGNTDGDYHQLYILLIFNINMLQYSWNQFTQYYKISIGVTNLFQVEYFNVQTMDMNRSESNLYFFKTNKIGKIKLSWFTQIILHKTLLISPIYIKL